MEVAQEEKKPETSLQYCVCCKSLHPILKEGMCPECNENRESNLNKLYDIERDLSHALQCFIETGAANKACIAEVTRARNGLRLVMRNMGWKKHF